MGSKKVTVGYKELQGVIRGYSGLQGAHCATRDYKGLPDVTEVTKDYTGLQGNTRAYRGLQGVSGASKLLHWVTWGYNGLQ